MRILVFLLTCLLGIGAQAQQNSADDGPPKKGSSFSDQLVVGGGLNVGFSNGSFVLGASPQVGYKITDNWTAGIGGEFTYFSTAFEGQNFNTTVYGGNLFTRVFVTPNIVANSEFRYINAPIYNEQDITSTTRTWIPMWLVGASYYFETSARSGFLVGANYDLINDVNSPYESSFPYNPIITMGFVYGL